MLEFIATVAPQYFDGGKTQLGLSQEALNLQLHPDDTAGLHLNIDFVGLQQMWRGGEYVRNSAHMTGGQ